MSLQKQTSGRFKILKMINNKTIKTLISYARAEEIFYFALMALIIILTIIGALK